MYYGIYIVSMVAIFGVLACLAYIMSRFQTAVGEKRKSMAPPTEDSTSAVTPPPSRSTIRGAQRVDTTPMSDRRLWEQIEYNTRMSADVLHRMWSLVVISMVLIFIGVIAMVAFSRMWGRL